MTALTRYAFDRDSEMCTDPDGPYVLFTEAERDKAEAVGELGAKVLGLQRWQSAALSWLRADESPSAYALRRDADDPMLSVAARGAE